MARQIYTRWKIRGTLTAETPIHVGGMGGDADTDLALAVNGCGNYYIPGTSLAGALRGWMTRSLDEDQIKNLWGDHENDKRGASFIIIDDAEINLKGMTIEIREGVGIDRYTGAAADGFKYSRAILPKGVTFPLNITLDCQSDQSPDEIWQLLFALENGDIRIGAAKTRGLGKVSLQVTSIERHDLNNAQGLFNSLLQQNLQQDWPQIKQETINRVGAYTSPDRLSLNITWKPRDPVMVKAEGNGIAVDILPLVSQATGKVHFVIPGSSIKGVLRAHAERIVRTLLEIDITPDRQGKLKFNEQIRLSKGEKQIELIDVIFGAAEKSDSDTKRSQGKIGILSVDDCYATIPMTAEHWSAVENATSMAVDDFKPLVNTALSKTEDHYKTLQPAMHVAVDRWTGGAADGMLYSVLEPIGVDWQPIGIHLDLERLKKYGEDHIKPAIALLLLVLRDFADRKIPIGYGTNRGMGTVEVIEITMNCSPIEGLPGIEGETTIASDLCGVNDQVLSDLTTVWQTWIAQNQEVA
ncbi:RAMP superfamily CRISPR-associated protein [Trichothermofontia sp.]